MSKKVLVISTSLRNNSNSDALADEFIRGVQESGNQVEKVSLRGKAINYCRGCFACLTTGRCAIRDDANAIVEKMLHADVLVFSSPIYYYEMCGQMKTLLDRANPLYSLDYQFRDVYFLSAAAENEESVDSRAVSGLEGWITCFPKSRLAGKVFAGGVTDPGEIQNHAALAKAYEAGKNV